MSATETCPRCSSTLPALARFCPRCGRSVVSDDTTELPPDPALEQARREQHELPSEFAGRPAPSVHRTERRPLGVPPLPFLAGMALGALVLAVVLWVGVNWIPGLGLLLVAVALAGLFWAGVRRQPESPTARGLAGVWSRVRDLISFVSASSRTWSRTGRQLVSLRWRRLRLQRELRSRLTPLGEAVHAGDGARTEALKSEAAAIQRRLDELDQREEAVVSSARSQIQRERAPVQATEAFTTVPAEGSGVPGKAADQNATDLEASASGGGYNLSQTD